MQAPALGREVGMSDESSISETSQTQTTLAIQASPAQRWELFYRLRSLDIACDYRTGGPLTVCCNYPLASIQCWCILKRLTQTRAESIDWLKACWHQK